MTEKQVAAALREGQFWRTADGRRGILVTSIEGETVTAFGALHGASGTTHLFSEEAFRSEFNVLAFDPTLADEDGPPSSKKEDLIGEPKEKPRLEPGQTISSLMHSDERRCYCRWSSGNFHCDLYCYQDVDGRWHIHVAANRHVGECPPVDWTAKPSDVTIQMTNRSKFFDVCERHLIDLPCDGESYRHQTLGDFKERLLALRVLGYRFPDSVLVAVEEEMLGLPVVRENQPKTVATNRQKRRAPSEISPATLPQASTFEPTWAAKTNTLRSAQVEYRSHRSGSNSSAR